MYVFPMTCVYLAFDEVAQGDNEEVTSNHTSMEIQRLLA